MLLSKGQPVNSANGRGASVTVRVHIITHLLLPSFLCHSQKELHSRKHRPVFVEFIAKCKHNIFIQVQESFLYLSFLQVYCSFPWPHTHTHFSCLCDELLPQLLRGEVSAHNC